MVLTAKNIRYRYPDGYLALKNANLSVDYGEIVALAGPNGSGKTTLLLVLAGLIDPLDGVVLYKGRPLKNQLPEVRRYIGIIFQNPEDQLFNSTVYDEIAFTLRQLGLSEDVISQRVHRIASELGLSELLNRHPYRLSMGEKKLVAIASVLVYDPEVILFDEPLSYLSWPGIKKITDIIRRFRYDGKSVVIASHNTDLIYELSDRVYLMNSGSTVAEVKTEELPGLSDLLEAVDLKPVVGLKMLNR
jgi:cobalt/nickel transport system ATP-binding protein